MRKDYKVRFRAREAIRGVAEDIRRLSGTAETPYFNLMDVFRRMERGEILKYERLKIILFDQSEGDPPAFVQYNPLRLTLDREIERLIAQGEPDARFIGGHEMGHLFLHDGEPQRFSGQKQRWISIDEESAEWQANVFADYVLLRDAHLNRRMTPAELSIQYSIPIGVVTRRLSLKESYIGEACPKCGNFTLKRRALKVWCDTCGQSGNSL